MYVLLSAGSSVRFMHLYLSSYRFGDDASFFAEVASKRPHVVVVENALDFIDGNRPKGVGFERELSDLSNLGLPAKELDLRDYFGDTQGLQNRLSGRPAIWVAGGNAFLLRRAMELSGLGAWLIEHVSDPDVVYGGYSAGVVVLAPLLQGIHLVDPPEQAAQSYPAEVIWEGLGILDFCVAPHYQSDHPDSAAIDSAVDYFEAHSLPYRTLRDGEALTLQL